MTDHKEIILSALEDIPGLGSLSDSWPDTETPLPAIVVDLASELTTDRRDDTRYLQELEYYVRIFASNAADTHAILGAVDPRMTALGYERTFRFDQNTAGAKQLITRYTKTIPSE